MSQKTVLNSLLWLFVFTPVFQLVWYFYQLQLAGNIFYLGPEPGKVLVHVMGQWAITFLLCVLAVQPLKRIFKLNLIKYRRRLGLSAFVYGLLHLVFYLFFLLGLEWGDFLEDLKKRPYMLVGMLSIMCMLPLAVTSTKGWQKRLGKKWKSLHKLVYPSALLVVVHLWWQVKSEFGLAVLITLLFMVILSLRIFPNLLARFQSSSNL